MSQPFNAQTVPRVVIASSAGVKLGPGGDLLICCVNCRVWKPLPDFGLRYMKDTDEMRSQSWCRPCRAEQMRQRAALGQDGDSPDLE